MKLQEYITDIAAGPFGSNLKVSCFVEKGFPIIDGANLKGYKVTDNITKFVTEEKARSLHRSIAKRGDVVVTISGNVGQISYIPDDSKYEEYLVSQRQFRASFDRDKVNVAFLVYFFHTREGQYKILSFANQVGVPALAQPLKNFRNIEIELPSKKEQDCIAAYIDNIEDKITVNRRICENLETQAQALFKHWFIDFAPFLDKPSGKAERKNGQFVESELGMIPLSEVCEQITDGVHNSVKDEPDSNYMLLSCKNIVGGVLSKNNYRSISKSTFESLRMRTKLAKGDVLLSSVGTIGEIAIVEEDPINYEFQRSVAIIKPKNNIGTYFLYNALLASKVRLQHAAHGAVQQCLFIGDLKKFEVICCDTENASRYNEIVRPLFEEIAKLHQESSRLSTLRDALLPKLMSGQIKV